MTCSDRAAGLRLTVENSTPGSRRPMPPARHHDASERSLSHREAHNRPEHKHGGCSPVQSAKPHHMHDPSHPTPNRPVHGSYAADLVPPSAGVRKTRRAMRGRDGKIRSPVRLARFPGADASGRSGVVDGRDESSRRHSACFGMWEDFYNEVLYST